MTDQNPLLTIDPFDADDAYEAVSARARAMPAEELRPIHLDPLDVVTATLRVARQLPGLEADLATHTRLTQAKLTEFERCVLGLYSAHLRFIHETTPAEQLQQLVGKATAWLRVLQTEEDALRAAGVLRPAQHAIKPQRVRGVTTVSSHLANVAHRLSAAWPKIAAHTRLQASDLREAEQLAIGTLAAATLRPNLGQPPGTAQDMRLRMYNLVFKSYDEIRRALHYVRWGEGDADAIAPPLSQLERRGVTGGAAGGNSSAPKAALVRVTERASAESKDSSPGSNVPAGMRGLVELLKSKSQAN